MTFCDLYCTYLNGIILIINSAMVHGGERSNKKFTFITESFQNLQKKIIKTIVGISLTIFAWYFEIITKWQKY